MIKRAFPILTILLIMHTYVQAVFAMEIPGRTRYLVNDYAGVLSVDQKKVLEKKLVDFKNKGPERVEIVLSTFQSLNGMSMNEFLPQYASKWRRFNDNRIHIIVVVKDRVMRIGVGYPLVSLLTSKDVDMLTNQVFIPYFQAGKYDEGLLKGTEAILNILRE